jgi:DNA-binding NarL/FixJ family response regulator
MSYDVKESTRILLVDSQEVVRAGLRMVINHHPGLQVSSEAASLAEAMTQIHQRPDVVIINLNLYDGACALAEIAGLARQTPVIILTGKGELDAHYRTLGEVVDSGVKGIVFREDPVESLIITIEKVRAGGVCLDHSTLARVLGKLLLVNNTKKTNPEAGRAAQLTNREREIVALISQGMKNKQVAERLSLSEATVRHRLTLIFNKLGVSDRLGLAIYAHQYDLAQASVAPPGFGSAKSGRVTSENMTEK